MVIDVDNYIKAMKEHNLVISEEVIRRLKNNMATLKEEAMAYEPKHTKNIAELDKVEVNLQLETREGTDDKGKVFKYKVTVLNGEDYRVPWTVLSDLKAILKVRPALEYIKVNREGTGLATKYTVIAL